MLKLFSRLTVLSALLLAMVSIAPARAADAPAAFIQNLGNQAIAVLSNPNESPATRKQTFARLFNQNFDVATIGRFVLGRYWRSTTPQQQQQYLQTFQEYVVSIYNDRFSQYSGEKFQVTGSDGNIVHSQVIRSNGGPPINIDWRLTQAGGGYKIVDVVVENLSMSVTQRDEFASVIDRNGGNVQALIDILKQKIAAS